MSISLDGIAYNLTYVGVDDDFVEQEGAVLSVDPWGMDQITRRWSGRLDKCETEYAKFKRERKKRDTVYNTLYYTDLRLIKSAPFASLEVTFKGLIDGNVPAPVISDSGYRRNTVELGIAENIGLTVLGGSTTITYNAPFVKVNFVSKSRRKFAKHSSLLDPGQLQIIKQTNAQAGALNLVNGSSLNGPEQTPQQIAGIVGRYNGTIEIQSAITSQKPIGQWWEGTETHEVLIVPMEQRIRALPFL
jgi:hypothetical protein